MPKVGKLIDLRYDGVHNQSDVSGVMLQVEPCCWMTYTTHRDTQETLQILDRLDLDTDKPTQEDIMKKFGLEEQFQTGSLNVWQKVKPRVWALFEEPYSSSAAKVSSSLATIFRRAIDINTNPFNASCSKLLLFEGLKVMLD